MRNKVISFLCLFLVVLLPAGHAEDGPRFVYRIGILSLKPLDQARLQWVPLRHYLKDRVPNADFEVIPMDFYELEKAVRANELDFVLTNPAQYYDLNEKFGIDRIATMEVYYGSMRSSLSGGVIFVRTNNELVRSWSDLKGKRFATIHENSFEAWLAVWRELKDRGIQPFRDFSSLRFVGTPEQVVEDVINGRVDAGSVAIGDLEQMASKGKIDLKDVYVIRDPSVSELGQENPSVLYSTRFYPQWPMARTGRITEKLSKEVLIALLEMAEDDLAAVMGNCAGWTIPLSYMPVAACLREISYGSFRNYGKMSEKEFLRLYQWRILGVVTFLILTLGVVFYVLRLNRRLLLSKRRLEEEIKAKDKIESELRRNETALKNMVMDLAQTYDSLQSVRDQLLQSDKLAALGQLAAGVAHELNNPLGFISNNIVLLREYWDKLKEILSLYGGLFVALEEGAPDMVSKALQDIDAKAAEYDMDYLMEDAKNIYTESLEGLERMQRIIRDLKTFARDERAVHSDEDICQIMDSILGIVHNEIKYKTVLKKEYASDLPLVSCNKQQIGQVFINILLNAVQAIEKHGEIRIRIYFDGGMVKVDIEDTGTGIPEQNLKKVFEPFFSTKEVGQGTGLGLSISYDIVQKHGGTISVVSKVGQGTTFTIALPLSGKA
ncbi:MAG: PhnD/SsuA/transferrin family substrate-binding protein [Candidatus Omnitrophica bacterium]|nr:PhnD/SsuA/transferrin family substrate-binding protein [Candidatus Omnitrophota bacterium]